MKDFNPTHLVIFKDGETIVKVHVQNDEYRHAWALEVISNGETYKAGPSSNYITVLECEGYCYATEYWDGTFPVRHPFKVVPLKA